jgi:ATP-dependent DNA helicase RecQ
MSNTLKAYDWSEKAELHTFMVRCALRSRDLPSAFSLAKQLTYKWPFWPDGWGVLGEVYRAMEDWFEAEKAYKQQQALAPDSWEPIVRLAQLYSDCAQPVSAMAYITRLVQQPSTEPPVPVHLLLKTLRLCSTHKHKAWLKPLKDKLRSEWKRQHTHLTHATHLQLNQIKDMTSSDQTKQQHDIQQAVLEHFGHSTLRPGQLESLEAIEQGRNVLAILPTGSGKSLLYQYPSLCHQKPTLVISPLVALMQDQWERLPPPLKQHAVVLHSSQESQAQQDALNNIREGTYQLIFAAPERLRQGRFVHAVGQSGIQCVVIDEAHCISMWGHQFRPDYRFIFRALRPLGAYQSIMLTATAPPHVERDMLSMLPNAPSPKVIRVSPYRPNLRLEVHPVQDAKQQRSVMIDLCQRLPGQGVVYCPTKKQCDQLAEQLQWSGVQAESYHADKTDRMERQTRFQEGTVRIIVATTAFGMGIDQSHIRFVLHEGLPICMEDYAQQIGRAGRDGAPALCLMAYTNWDVQRMFNSHHAEVDITFLRELYSLLKHAIGVEHTGQLAGTHICEQMNIDSTQLRIALSLLEQSGLLIRYGDTPQSAIVRRYDAFERPNHSIHGIQQTLDQIGIPLHHTDRISIAKAARTLQLSPNELHWNLLSWSHQEYIMYQPQRRMMTMMLLKGHQDTSDAIRRCLETRAYHHECRIDSWHQYLTTERCRQAQLQDYLGGEKDIQCGICDICSPEQNFLM